MKKKLDSRLLFFKSRKKFYAIMRIFTFMMLVFSMHLSATTYSQQTKMSLNMKNVGLSEVFNKIKTTTEYGFFYNMEDLKKIGSINIVVEDATIDEIMIKVLDNTGLSYKLVSNTIIIKPFVGENSLQQRNVIKGKVKDEKGDPLPGVSVVIKGSNLGVATDIDGTFELPVKGNELPVLVISFIGMRTMEVKFNGEKFLNIVLKSDSEDLDEVIVTGYQKIDRKLFTGSATVVKSKDAVIEGVSDVGRMLQGKAAGVQVQNVSGTFGASPKIRVRGSSSIYGSSNPLWVVDGVVLEDVVEISADDLASGNAITLIGSAVAGINANDIETFQILKDASATALYGARAMNGVIIITTKKGKKGQVRVNYSLEATMKMKPSYTNYDILNSQQQMGVYLDMQAKGLLNHADMARSSNGGVFNKMYDLINTYNPETQQFGLENTIAAKNAYLRKAELRNTDWFDELFKSSIQKNHSLSIAGGSDNASFYASIGFLDDPGWTVADNVKRFTANLNSTVKIGEFVDLNITTSNSLRKQQVPGSLDRQRDVVSGEYNRNFDINPFSYALNASRTMAARGENGEYEFYNMNYAPFSILNESKYNYIDLDYLDSKIQAEISAYLLPGLNVRALGALRYVKTTREHKIHERSNLANAYRAAEDATISQSNQFLYKDPENPAALPEVVLPAGGFYNRDDNTLFNYYFRATANYNKIFEEKHNVNGLFGHEIKYADRTYSFNRGYGYQWGKGGVPFVDYRILRQILESGFQYFGMSQNYDRFVAFFASLGYSYDDRYTFNMTGRYDGSNRLGKSKSARWLPTWNLSGAWHIKREKFMEDVDLISALNLRATYGLTASMGPASNAMAIYINEVSFRPYQVEKENQIILRELENQDLTWEKQYETNVGFDMGIIDNRISVSADIYYRRGFDLIGYVSTSGIGGQSYKAANYADMKSSGVEFTLNTRNIYTRNFSWTSNLTFSYNENEITRLGSIPSVFDLVREEGGAVEGYPVKGLFSVPFEKLDESGFPILTDSYGESSNIGVSFQSRNVKYLKYEGPIDPKIVGGFDNKFKYKGLSLNIYFTYQAGNKIRLYPGFKSTYSDVQSMSKDMLDRWILPGDEKYTNIPVIPSQRQLKENPYLKEAYNSYNYSTTRVADGGFIRLKDISLSYDFPTERNMQLKFAASNVALLYSDKKLNGQDPEFFRAGGVAMPLPRQFTLSFKIGF